MFYFPILRLFFFLPLLPPSYFSLADVTLSPDHFSFLSLVDFSLPVSDVSSLASRQREREVTRLLLTNHIKGERSVSDYWFGKYHDFTCTTHGAHFSYWSLFSHSRRYIQIFRTLYLITSICFSLLSYHL